MAFVTDLNVRERKRYVEYFDSMAESARRVSESLRSGADQVAMIELIGIAMTDKPLRELLDVFKDAVNTEVPDNLSALDKPSK